MVTVLSKSLVTFSFKISFLLFYFYIFSFPCLFPSILFFFISQTNTVDQNNCINNCKINHKKSKRGSKTFAHRCRTWFLPVFLRA